MEWGTPVWWGWFLLFLRSGGHKAKETYPTRPGSPTPCKQGLNLYDLLRRQNSVAATNTFSKFSSTHEAICRCDVSPHRVAATCRLVCTDL